jgi:hypothetical protein
MVGSDLESQDHYGSKNLQDLAGSWDPDIGDIIVIYGGLTKPDGTTVLPLPIWNF